MKDKQKTRFVNVLIQKKLSLMSHDKDTLPVKKEGLYIPAAQLEIYKQRRGLLL